MTIGAQLIADMHAPPPASDPWPRALGSAAYHGVLGDIVRVLEPQTESDSAALLTQCLVFLGNVIGRTAHFVVEDDTHYLNTFLVIVGSTSSGKGVSLNRVRKVFAGIDTDWDRRCIRSGLSSGQGLIFHVRDPVQEEKDGEVVITDPGVDDKRLLSLETEFSSMLRLAERPGNNLSGVVRDLWDGRKAETLTKQNAVKATGAHVSLIGHVTPVDLKRYLTSTEAANGHGNRYLWCCARRSKTLPEGGAPVDYTRYQTYLTNAVTEARRGFRLTRDDEARELWASAYGQLTNDVPGLLGALTARGRSQVMRLAALYAVADIQRTIQAPHLEAALEVWRYCFDSVGYIFGDALGDPVADEILAGLRRTEEGLTRTDISTHLFQRNKPSQDIDRALGLLTELGRARQTIEPSNGGRPTERWYLGSTARTN